jgi:hypothetical protein
MIFPLMPLLPPLGSEESSPMYILNHHWRPIYCGPADLQPRSGAFCIGPLWAAVLRFLVGLRPPLVSCYP